MIRLRLGVFFLGLAAAGCGGGPDDAPEIAAVSGIVTVKGQPAADLNVTFHPESGGRPATGVTGPDGTFTLTTLNTGDGAPVGTSKASVTAAGGEVMGDSGPPMPGMEGYAEYMQAQAEKIDPKYADPATSGLVYTVPEDGLDNVEIKIP
ncbi:MAG: hypothetical protein WBC44_16210 [Planctomycetaceae bacterium]